MNICRNDIYFLIIFIILIYLLYKDFYKSEKFDSVSDTKALINQVYNADIEAIRNLSSIASKLIKEGGLVVPGKLQVTDKLTTNSDVIIGGKLNLPNNTSLSADGDNATQWLRLQQTNNPAQYKSLAVKDLWCNTGDSILYSTTINNTGNVQINGNATVNGTFLCTNSTTNGNLTAGNANVNGKLTVNDQETTGNATINGNLTVNTITVNSIRLGGYNIWVKDHYMHFGIGPSKIKLF